MKIKFDIAQVETMMKLNLASIIIIGFCEIFAVSMLITKGLGSDVVKWKFFVYVAVVGIISLLLLASILLFIYFLRLKKKNSK